MSNRPLGILVALLLATVALLLGSYTWFLAPPTHSTSFPGEIPWQEVLLFLSAILLWFAGVTAIYNLGGREKVIYALDAGLLRRGHRWLFLRGKSCMTERWARV